MALIDGIGGAFVFSDDATRLAEWYADAFGFQFEGDAEFGLVFVFVHEVSHLADERQVGFKRGRQRYVGLVESLE